MTIWFDMDGTIADLYGVEDWLNYLMNENPYPYVNAKTLLNFSLLARLLNKVQTKGFQIGIISWTSKVGSTDYNEKVTLAKMEWLAKHLKSVRWDEIKIVNYGTNKFEECGGGILFDDEIGNREAWGENAFEPTMIIEKLKELIG